MGSISGSGRSPGEGNYNSLQYSCLGNPMDRGAWWATVHGVSRVRHNRATKQQQQLPALEHLIRSADASVQQLPLPTLPPSLTYKCSKSLPSKPPVCKFPSPSVFLRTQPMTKHLWLKCIYFLVTPRRESRLINVTLTWYSIIFCCSREKSAAYEDGGGEENGERKQICEGPGLFQNLQIPYVNLGQKPMLYIIVVEGKKGAIQLRMWMHTTDFPGNKSCYHVRTERD